MAEMIDIMFDKLYRYDRIAEPCGVCIPVGKGKLYNTDKVSIYQDGVKMLSQTKVTSRYPDGSVRYMYVRFQADLPGNKGTALKLAFEDSGSAEENKDCMKIKVTDNSDGYTVDTGVLKFSVKDDSDGIFESVQDGYKDYTKDNFAGPFLKDGNGIKYDVKIGKWYVAEQGDVCTILTAC